MGSRYFCTQQQPWRDKQSNYWNSQLLWLKGDHHIPTLLHDAAFGPLRRDRGLVQLKEVSIPFTIAPYAYRITPAMPSAILNIVHLQSSSFLLIIKAYSWSIFRYMNCLPSFIEVAFTYSIKWRHILTSKSLQYHLNKKLDFCEEGKAQNIPDIMCSKGRQDDRCSHP